MTDVTEIGILYCSDLFWISDNVALEACQQLWRWFHNRKLVKVVGELTAGLAAHPHGCSASHRSPFDACEGVSREARPRARGSGACGFSAFSVTSSDVEAEKEGAKGINDTSAKNCLMQLRNGPNQLFT